MGADGINANAKSMFEKLFLVRTEKFMSDFRYIVFKAKYGASKQKCLGYVQEGTRWYIPMHEIRNKRKCDAAHDEQHRTSILNFRLCSHD